MTTAEYEQAAKELYGFLRAHAIIAENTRSFDTLDRVASDLRTEIRIKANALADALGRLAASVPDGADAEVTYDAYEIFARLGRYGYASLVEGEMQSIEPLLRLHGHVKRINESLADTV